MIHFPRTSLARELVDALSGDVSLSDAPNGLFLAAPRRTGKSTFLRFDLCPELDRRGALPIYVDLWSDKGRDPAELITGAIRDAAVKTMGLGQKLKKSMKGKVAAMGVGVSFDPDAIGRRDGLSLPEGLVRLHEVAKRPICLIVDEAQHALTTKGGANAMSALKSARDQMNGPGSVALMLVMSGSDRDKLLRLVNSNAAPFFGSHISRMPLLGLPYVEHVTAEVRRTYPELGKVSAEELLTPFELFGARPQFFVDAINEAIRDAKSGRSFDETVLSLAKNAEEMAYEQMEATYMALPGLERAILWAMLESGGGFRPYDAKALAFYRKKTGKAVTAAQTQAALARLREREGPLVWKSARGEYAIEDAAMARWFEALRDLKRWPPSS